jgi:hypothetical protein
LARPGRRRGPDSTWEVSALQDTLVKKLIEVKKISSQQVAEAQKIAKSNGGNLALSLVRLGALSEQ